MRRLISTLRAIWARPDGRFVVLDLSILVVAFTVIALKPVDELAVVPFTELVARASAAVLELLGEDVRVLGCELRSSRFAVTIYNGCNGVITSLIFAAGVLAFPARWRAKAVGLVGGLVAIQAINLVRILCLYYTGVFLPELFSAAHIWGWQSIVILSGVALWVVWARNVASPRADDP
jgi:exosortase H (IPTLxxWG-CTERM-specific)